MKSNHYKDMDHSDKELNRLGLVSNPAAVQEYGIVHSLLMVHDMFQQLERIKCKSPNARANTLGYLPFPDANCGYIDTLLIEIGCNTALGLCLVCVKQGKLSSGPHSFCAWGPDMFSNLEAPFPLWMPANLWGDETSTSPVDLPKAGGNCMSSTRWHHEARQGSYGVPAGRVHDFMMDKRMYEKYQLDPIGAWN